jgi:hypothetical protein
MDTMVLEKPRRIGVVTKVKEPQQKTLADIFGKLKRGIDGVEYQTSARNEWKAGGVPKGKRIERELTPEEEKTAFLYTAKLNAVKMLANYTE